MKIEGLVTDVTSVGSPDRANRGIFGVILDIFWTMQAAIVAGEPLCDLGTPA